MRLLAIFISKLAADAAKTNSWHHAAHEEVDRGSWDERLPTLLPLTADRQKRVPIMMDPTSPMSAATEQTAPEPKIATSNVASSDVVATRHLRIVLESITADKNLSEEDRKRKIANFGAVLMANAATKAPPVNDEKPKITTPSAATDYAKLKEDKKMELIRAAVLAQEEKRKKKSIPVKKSEEPEATPAPAPAPSAAISSPSPKPETKETQQSKSETKKKTATVSKPETKETQQPKSETKETQQPKSETKKSQQPKSETKKKTATASKPDTSSQKENSRETKKTTTSSASVIPLGTISTQQTKSNAKKKKGWLLRKLKGKKNKVEMRGDVDESSRFSERDQAEMLSISEVGSEVTNDTAAYGGYVMGIRSNTSDDSDRSIGTFEKDFMNDIIRDQESNYEEEDALSEGTFEQDARAAGALSVLSEGTFEQDARAVEGGSVFVPHQIPQQVMGDMPNMSEATFEQDTAYYRDDEPIGIAGSELSNTSYGSETTFERDMRIKEASKAAHVPTTQIFENPSLESVTTFEKEARGRMEVAAKSRSFHTVDDNYAEHNSEYATSDCSDTFMQDVAQDMHPVEPEPETVWETTAAPYPMPKITELQMQLSPETISKTSRGGKFFSKFTCHCA